MFGLTPRANKKTPVPPQQQESEKVSARPDGPGTEEQRLAYALAIVLAKKPRAHRRSTEGPGGSALANRIDQTDQHLPKSPNLSATKPTGSVGLLDQTGPGFFWVATNPDQGETQSTSKISIRWLKRAQREDRWANLRRRTQWILLGCTACAVFMLTVWPSTS